LAGKIKAVLHKVFSVLGIRVVGDGFLQGLYKRNIWPRKI